MYEILGYVFTDATKKDGWGTMDRDTWSEQIRTYDELSQFTKSVPTVDDVMTLSLLEATRDARPRLDSGRYGAGTS